METAAGEIVEAEAELCLFDPVFDVRLRPMPAFELVGGAVVVVADEHVVVVVALVEAQLLAELDRVAADDEAPLLLPRLRLAVEAHDLAAGSVARGLPVARRDHGDPRLHRGDLRRPDRIGDLPLLEPGEEVLAPKALVGAQQHPRAVGQATQTLPHKARGAGRGRCVAVPELAVQPLARLADKAEQRMPGDLAGVGAARALPGADPPVVLDQGRIQIERHHPPVEQRMHAHKQLLERALELAQMPQAEAREESAERGRIGHRMTP